MNDSRNMILAIVLSILVLVGWQYFIAGPQADRAAKLAQLQQQQQAQTQAATNAWAGNMRQLQAEDVAETILFCVTRPAHVSINEVLMRPTDQER